MSERLAIRYAECLSKTESAWSVTILDENHARIKLSLPTDVLGVRGDNMVLLPAWALMSIGIDAYAVRTTRGSAYSLGDKLTFKNGVYHIRSTRTNSLMTVVIETQPADSDWVYRGCRIVSYALSDGPLTAIAVIDGSQLKSFKSLSSDDDRVLRFLRLTLVPHSSVEIESFKRRCLICNADISESEVFCSSRCEIAGGIL